MSSFSDTIKRASGRTIAPPAGAEPEPADLGVGRGGGARPLPRRRDSGAINDALRAAARRATNRVDLDGVSLDDVFEDGS
jgi:hypothetical protein